MRHVLSAICILAGLSCTEKAPVAQQPASATSRPVLPADVQSLIDRAEEALDSKRSDVSTVLSDANYLSAHAWPRFRQAIKRHARGSKVTMVTAQEPGERMRVRMRLVEADGSACVGALVYAYHTDARGDYGPNDANIPLVGSDNNYSRLFCYAVTDSDGRLEIQTIRPGGYPDDDTPAHIHLRITTRSGRSYGSDIWFDDDPRLNRAAREEAARDRIVICRVVTDDGGQRSIDAEIKLD